MHPLRDELELVSVVDPDVARARTLAALHGPGAYSTLADALSNVGFEAVSVSTPTGAHGEVSIEALRSGKHVLIEKPAEVSLEKTDAIIAAQQRAGTVVSVVSQHRFDPATKIVLAAIESGGWDSSHPELPPATGGEIRNTTTRGTGGVRGAGTAGEL
ncbi:Gfo/Idh/MocA family protein [Arthrobacter sp. R4]|uniref:Gfo/Idh/MocA family protein n=1 Tax=Arthrobacter sp. R4 TaxID=644417 RepID=UPI003EDA19E7